MLRCRRCGFEKLWKLSSGKVRCANCRTSFHPRVGGVVVPPALLRRVVAEFDLEHSTNVILERCAISKYKLLTLLTAIRRTMATDLPAPFSGIVEVDETYVGGQWKNKRKSARRWSAKRGRGTSKQPVFGILCRDRQVWAEIVAGVEARDLQPRIEQRVRKGAVVCSDGWRGYTGLATKGYVHRLVDHGSGKYSDRRGSHINGLEGFWGYLKRKLAQKGGIRRERLPLFLAEYVWRYNHRQQSHKQRVNVLLSLIRGVHI